MSNVVQGQMLPEDLKKTVAQITTSINNNAINTASIEQIPQAWSEWLKNQWSFMKTYATKNADNIKLNAAFVVLGTTCIALSYLNATTGTNNSFELPSIPGVVGALAAQYCRYFFVNAMHEGGHALADYAINDVVSDVHLGSNDPTGGFEVLPHTFVNGWHPSLGITTHPDQFKDKVKKMADKAKGCFAKILARLGKTATEGTLTLEELKAQPEFKDALAEAQREAQQEAQQKNSLNFFSVAIAGVIAGLVANGLVKVGTGASLTSLDYIDLYQLFNLIPLRSSDGDQIATTVFGLPAGTEDSDQYATLLIMLILFGKGFFDQKNQNPSLETVNTVFRAAGLAAFNFIGLGKAHITAV